MIDEIIEACEKAWGDFGAWIGDKLVIPIIALGLFATYPIWAIPYKLFFKKRKGERSEGE